MVDSPVSTSQDAAEMLTTVRCIIAASTDGAIDFDVPSIAARTGLTIEAVRHVLSSPIYQQLLEQECVRLISHSLVRGVREMDRIVNSESKNSDKIAAHRAIANTYQTIFYRPKQPKSPDGDDPDRWAEKFIPKEKSTT